MATRLDVIKDFIRISGRYDLVTDVAGDDYSDAGVLGASHFLDSALRWLDSLATHRKVAAELKEDLVQGQYQIDLPNTRAIQGLRVIDDGLTEGATELEKVSREALYRMYAVDAPLADVEEGRPQHYAIDVLRQGGTQTDTQAQEEGLIFMPPCDKDYDLYIKVLYYSAPLAADGDKNFWSLLYPDLLVRAMMRQLSAHYQNTAGVRDWEVPVLQQIEDIDRDQVETEAAEITHMQDSWRFEW